MSVCEQRHPNPRQELQVYLQQHAQLSSQSKPLTESSIRYLYSQKQKTYIPWQFNTDCTHCLVFYQPMHQFDCNGCQVRRHLGTTPPSLLAATRIMLVNRRPSRRKPGISLQSSILYVVGAKGIWSLDTTECLYHERTHCLR